jgi:hypothetical protein
MVILPLCPRCTRRTVLLRTSALALLLALAAPARPAVGPEASEEAWSDGTRFDDGRGFAA